MSPSAAEVAHAIPAPALDEPAGQATSEVAVLAGGCFWGVQGVFQHVDGVTSAVSGYAGGDKATAQYETVSSGTTGHAESVQITFDPRKISYGRLLQIYFSVAHDPTELNRQGPDDGTQYRSAIFPTNAEQAAIAKAYIAQLDQAHAFDAAIVTRIEPGTSLLSGRGLPPGFPDAAPDLPLHRLQRPAEDRESEAPVPGSLSRRSGARRGGRLIKRANLRARAHRLRPALEAALGLAPAYGRAKDKNPVGLGRYGAWIMPAG